jgi:Tfp pilus assembly protein PilX
MTLQPTARSERGFSMFIVIVAMLVTSMFVAAGFAAANGDIVLSKSSKDRKASYAAAEAGLNYYQSKLNQNPDYWTLCDTGPAPKAGENNPVTQPWTGTGTRKWRNLPSSKAQYTIELLPIKGQSTCKAGAEAEKTMIDKMTGTFRVRATGRSLTNGKPTRSLVATYRRDGFLNFLWFTEYEDLDPQAEATQSDRDWFAANCGKKYRADRNKVDSCDEISFITGDKMNGPMHTNDSFLYCGTPQWGRTAADRIEVSTKAPGYYANGGGCSAPNIQGTFEADTKPMYMPPSNDKLEATATATGQVFYGKTSIRFLGNGKMQVSYMDPTDPTLKRVISNSYDEPDNGVIYVKGIGACTTASPRVADYKESPGCGNLYVSGTYSHSMTLAAANDIIVKPTDPAKTTDANLVRSNDSVLGLIANNFVRVFHACDRTASPDKTASPVLGDVKIQAAILSLQHSFILDNHDCGSPLGKLTVEGVIAQLYRGTVSTHSSGTVKSGYLKDYNYDDRLRYRSPPYFLNPVDAAWRIVKVNEQVNPWPGKPTG